MTTAALSAVVPAFEEQESVGETVRALLAIEAVREVVVVDDGSADQTAERALAAGARVIRHPRRVGKAGALRTGASNVRMPVVLLADADLGAAARRLGALCPLVLSGEADMVVAVPLRRRGGGMGLVRRLAVWGIRRFGGWTPAAPLSGQRAVRLDLLRHLLDGPAVRFGVEVQMGILAGRLGARVAEVPLDFSHRFSTWKPSGWVHRGRQLGDVALTLWRLRRLGGASYQPEGKRA